MRVYLDNCIFNRPFDDQSQPRIEKETEAVVKILGRIKEGVLELIWSSTIDHENDNNPIIERRELVAQWRSAASVEVFATEKVRELSEKLIGLGFGAFDAVHIASAIHASADYFVTTDDGVLKRADRIADLRIVDPVKLISVIESKDEH